MIDFSRRELCIFYTKMWHSAQPYCTSRHPSPRPSRPCPDLEARGGKIHPPTDYPPMGVPPRCWCPADSASGCKLLAGGWGGDGQTVSLSTTEGPSRGCLAGGGGSVRGATATALGVRLRRVRVISLICVRVHCTRALVSIQLYLLHLDIRIHSRLMVCMSARDA